MKVLWELQKKSPPLRKSVSLLKQLPRFARVWTGSDGPPYSVLANSVPKSGTHLLVQILEALPEIRNYDSFIATTPTVRFRQRTPEALLRRISWIVPGELASAHLYYDERYQRALSRKRCLHFLIVRDPRDVALSEAHYLTHMNRWHRAHHYFARRLSNENERLLRSILGIPAGEVPYRFPDIGGRLKPYLSWLAQPDVCTLRFEELVSSRRDSALLRVASFFRAGSTLHHDARELVDAMRKNIDPQRSRTFRSGKSGAWREVFGEHHRTAMKKVAGELLIELGYEDDFDW